MLPLVVAGIFAGLIPLVLTDPLPQADIVDRDVCVYQNPLAVIVKEHVVYIDHLFEANTIININGGIIIVSNAPTQIVTTITSTETVTTTVPPPTNSAA